MHVGYRQNVMLFVHNIKNARPYNVIRVSLRLVVLTICHNHQPYILTLHLFLHNPNANRCLQTYKMGCQATRPVSNYVTTRASELSQYRSRQIRHKWAKDQQCGDFIFCCCCLWTRCHQGFSWNLVAYATLNPYTDQLSLVLIVNWIIRNKLQRNLH